MCWSHATPGLEQLISNLRVGLVDAISSLPDSEGVVIPLSEVCELLLKIHDTLGQCCVQTSWEFCLYLSTCVFILLPGNVVVSGLHSSPFFTVSRMWFLPSEASLYGHINQSCTGSATVLYRACYCLFSKRGGKARPWTGFFFTVQKRPVPGSSGASLAKRPYLESGTEMHPGGKKSAGSGVSASSANAKRKRGHAGSALLMCHSPQLPHHPYLHYFRLVCFDIFLINGVALLLTGWSIIWFRVTIFSLGHALPCFIVSGTSM